MIKWSCLERNILLDYSLYKFFVSLFYINLTMKLKTILVLIWVFILIDFTKINDLWSENIHRRILHHLQRGQFNPNKEPWINFLGKTLTPKQIDDILNIKINKDTNCMATISPHLSKLFGGNYSKKCTLYYNDFDYEIQKKMDELGKSMIPRLEKIAGKKLYLGNSDFRCVLLRYEGKDSQFVCHHDTEPKNCYRTLFLVKKEGRVPPFIHYDKNGNPIKTYFEEGEGLFFQGTKTFHCVGKTDDPNMKRYMIGWQYTTDPDVKDISLCSKLRSANMNKVIKIFIPNFLITIIFGIIFWWVVKDPYTNKELMILIVVTLFTSIISYFIPKYINKYAIGSGMSSTLRTLFAITIISIISFANVFYGLLFMNYLLITEMILPSSIVSKSLSI
jgi:hypothetical protein